MFCAIRDKGLFEFFAIDFPSRRVLKAIQNNKSRRDHVVRQYTAQRSAQFGGSDPSPGDHVGDEFVLPPVVLDRVDERLLDGRQCLQCLWTPPNQSCCRES